MIRPLQILLATTLGFAISAQAQEDNSPTRTAAQRDNITNNLDKTGDTSVGLKWGDLTGVEFKHWTDQKNAMVLGIALDEGNTAVGIDYLWHFRGGIAATTGLKNSDAFVPYIGAGLIGAFGDEDTDLFDHETDDFGLALRAPIGVEFLPRRISLGVFAEVAPSFGVAPTTFTFITADIGARYYF